MPGALTAPPMIEKPPVPRYPRSAADPRGGEPFWIDSHCKFCDAPLRLNDIIYQGHVPVEPNEVWHDEWVCPNECYTDENGIHGIVMDWPRRCVKEADPEPMSFVTPEEHGIGFEF